VRNPDPDILLELWEFPAGNTLQETDISHLRKRKIIVKISAFGRKRVSFQEGKTCFVAV